MDPRRSDLGSQISIAYGGLQTASQDQKNEPADQIDPDSDAPIAEDEATPDELDDLKLHEDDWRIIVGLAGWIPVEVRGTVTAGRIDTGIAVDAGTILDDLEWVFEGAVEFTNDEWSVAAWGFGWGLETNVSSSGDILGIPVKIDTKLELTQTMLEVNLLRRIVGGPLGDSETTTWGLDFGGGMRYWTTEVEINARDSLGIDPNIDIDEDWVDPILAARLRFHVGRSINTFVRADIGGFGVGTASDLTWSITAAADIRLAPKVGLLVGYKYLELDWSRGSGSSEIGFDYYMHGPILGVHIVF